jgi:hypothetical protein
VREGYTRPHKGPKTRNFGPVRINVDYSGLGPLLTQLGEGRYLNHMHRLLTEDEKTELWPEIAGLDSAARSWLAHAFYLYMRNQETLRGHLRAANVRPAYFDEPAAVARLIARSAEHTTMPAPRTSAFEREVLGVSGWTEAVVPRALARLPEEVVARLHLIYHPPRSGNGDEGRPRPGPMNAAMLEAELLPVLREDIARQAEYWRPPQGGQLEPEPIDRIMNLADFMQIYVAACLQPYADGRRDGPFYTGFRYSEHLRSTYELPAEPADQSGYLFNRMLRIGWDATYGRLLAVAQYDGGRAGDRETLRDLAAASLAADEALRGDVVHLIRHMSAHGGGADKIFFQPVFPGPSWGTRAKWRWRTIRTLTHELLHRLAHPGFLATATDQRLNIADSLIISEGFVDLLTTDIYTQLLGEVKTNPTAAELLFGGVGDPGTPDGPLLGIGYGGAGMSADQIRLLVTDDRVRAAFFLGAIHLVGLDLP